MNINKSKSDESRLSQRERLNIPSDIPDDFFELVSGLVDFIEQVDKSRKG